MSKVGVNQRPEVVIPPEYFSAIKPSCSSFEQLIKVQPQTTAFNSSSVPVKQIVKLPNVNFRLNEVYIEADVTVTFTSNSGSDTYAAVQPTIVPYATSLINEV